MTNLASYRCEPTPKRGIVLPIQYTVTNTLGTRGFFSRATRSFVGHRPTRLDRNRKPRVKSLWARSIQPKFQPVRPGKRTTLKGGPVFSKLFRLDRTDPLSFGPKFPESLVEWIAPSTRGRSPMGPKIWPYRKNWVAVLSGQGQFS